MVNDIFFQLLVLDVFNNCANKISEKDVKLYLTKYFYQEFPIHDPMRLNLSLNLIGILGY